MAPTAKTSRSALIAVTDRLPLPARVNARRRRKLLALSQLQREIPLRTFAERAGAQCGWPSLHVNSTIPLAVHTAIRATPSAPGNSTNRR